MYTQEPIKQRQVEGLISGAIGAYNGLLSLDGSSTSRTYQAGNFTGASKVTVNNTVELDKIVENLIGLTFHTAIPAQKIYAEHVFNEYNPQSEISNFGEEYDSKLIDASESLTGYLRRERGTAQIKILDVKSAMRDLQESYATNDVQNVADAIAKVGEIATWGTAVQVKPLYDAADSMKQMSGFNVRLGFNDARPIYDSLMRTMIDAQVKENHSFLGIPYKLLAPPNESQVYRGNLDHEFIAMDLMRQK